MQEASGFVRRSNLNAGCPFGGAKVVSGLSHRFGHCGLSLVSVLRAITGPNPSLNRSAAILVLLLNSGPVVAAPG